MSIKTLIFSFLLCIPFTVHAQWYELNIPEGDAIRMEVVNNDTLVYFDNDNGKIHSSWDGGNTWTTDENAQTNFWIYDFDFVNDQTGYACGRFIDELDRSVIFKTENAGMSWDTVSTFNMNSLSKMDFLNPDTGFVSYSHKLFFTEDGGQTLVPSVYDESSLGQINDIHFTPNGNIFLVSRKSPAPEFYISSMYRSEDFGQTWFQVYSDTLIGVDYSENRNLQKVDFPTDEIGYAVGGTGTFLKTTDAGLTWNPIESDLFPNLYAVDFLSDEVGYINSLNGIYKTSDGGENWDFQYVNDVPTNVNDIQFASIETGYAQVDQTIYKTTNGGESTAIPETNNSSDIRVFPNPVRNTLTIRCSPELEAQRIEIVNVLGKTIKTIGSPALNVDVSQLSSGNYFLKITTNRGLVVKKLLVE